jgi:hypothetical protein
MSFRERQISRRTVLRTAGSAAAVVGGASVVGTASAQSAWTVAETPTVQPLYDAVHAGDGPYAVGGEGEVLRRADGGWEIVVEDGPGRRQRSLYTAATSDDGRRVWFAGDTGALGAYDVDEDRKYDYSYPAGVDDNLQGLVVDGDSYGERVMVASDSGQTIDGRFTDDGFDWSEPVEPAGGAGIVGLTFTEDSLGSTPSVVGADGSQTAFESPDFNDSWSQFGVDGADETFRDVETLPGNVYVSTDAGVVYRYDEETDTWTPVTVDDAGAAVYGLDDSPDDESLLATGIEGRVHEGDGEGDWTTAETPAAVTLRGVSYAEDLGLLTDPVDVAVGEDGAIVERPVGG